MVAVLICLLRYALNYIGADASAVTDNDLAQVALQLIGGGATVWGLIEAWRHHKLAQLQKTDNAESK